MDAMKTFPAGAMAVGLHGCAGVRRNDRVGKM